MKTSGWLMIAVALGIIGQARGQSGRPDVAPKFNSKAANDAEAEYRKEVAAADADRKDRVDRAKAKLTPILEAAKSAATKADQLEEAVAIRDRIKELSRETAPTPAAVSPERKARRELAEAIQDVVWVGSPHGPVIFGRNGLIKTPNPMQKPWRWEAVDGNTVMARYEAGNIDIFFFDLNKGVVEAYGFGAPQKEQHFWTARRAVSR